MEDGKLATKEDVLNDLLQHCDKAKPSPEDVKALRKALALATPARIKKIDDFAKNNIETILAGKKYPTLARELTKADLNVKRNELGYETSPAMEQMIIDSLLLAWLRYQEAEYVFTNLEEDGMSLPKGSYWERRLTAAQGRYLKACETLARVRRLTRPMVQVNVAQDGSQQLNVAGDLVKT